MVYENQDRIEARIRKLSRELEQIDDFFYGSEKDNDRLLYMGMLERKRDDFVRSIVLQMHTSIDDLLTQMLFEWILGAEHLKAGPKLRTKRGQALGRMLAGGRALGFEMKLDFAVVVGVINTETRNKIRELNTVRNKCSHHWVLDVPIRRGRKTTRQRLPRLLNFRGHDLHKVDVLKDFSREYGEIYCRLFTKAIS